MKYSMIQRYIILMNKIPRCSNSILFYFPLFSALHVSGFTITHHQGLPLYIRLWYNNINRSLAERSVCQNRVGGGECGSEMSPVRVSEPDILFIKSHDARKHATQKYIILFICLFCVFLQGHSPAGGCLLAVSCEYRVMVGPKYTIGLNETQLGIIAPKW
jgi:hypothetical protein